MDESTPRPDQALAEQTAPDQPAEPSGPDQPAEPSGPDAATEDSGSDRADAAASAEGDAPKPDQDAPEAEAGDFADDLGPFRPAPRLDALGSGSGRDGRPRETDAGVPPRPILSPAGPPPPRQVAFTRLYEEEDEADPDFGPTLAAWLADYRSRQRVHAAGPASSWAETDHRLAAAEPKRQPPAARAADRARLSGAGSHGRWSGRAHRAPGDIAAAAAAGLRARRAAGRRPVDPARGGGSRRATLISIAALLAGVAALAVVAAARTSGVGLDVKSVVAGLGKPILATPEASVTGRTSAGGAVTAAAALVQPQPEPSDKPDVTPAPAPDPLPSIRIVPTRIVSASIGGPHVAAGVSIAPSRDPAPQLDDRIETAGSSLMTPTRPARSTPALPQAEAATAASTEEAPFAAASAAAEVPGPARSEPQVARSTAAVPAVLPEPADGTEATARVVRIASLDATSLALGSTPAAAALVESVPIINVALLLARADALLELGDVLSARLLFERAAATGDARGALGAGATFDPVRYGEIGVRGIEADPDAALAWYRSALDAGAADAAAEIAALEAWMRR